MRTKQHGKATTWTSAGLLTVCLLTLCLLAGHAARAQGTSSTVKDDLFAGTEKFAQGASDVNEITMDPDSLGLVDGDHAHRAHNLVLNVVRTYEYDKPGMYRIEDVEAFRKKLETGDWRCSIHTRDLKHGDSTDVCNRHRTDGMIESAIITVEPKQLTFIHTIRKAADGQSREVLPAISGEWPLSGAQAAQLAELGPAMSAQMGAQWAVQQAKMEAMEPVLQARLAGLWSHSAMALPGLHDHLDAPQPRQRFLFPDGSSPSAAPPTPGAPIQSK